MFEKRSLGIAFEADGTVRAAELVSTLRTVTLARAWVLEPEGADNFDSWKRALDTLRGSGVELENAVFGIPDSLIYRKHLSFPFNNRKRIMQILDSELDGEIPLPIGSVVADFIAGSSEGGGLHCLAMACDKNTLSRFLEMFGPGARVKGVQTGSVGLAAASLRGGMTSGVSVLCSLSDAQLIEFRSAKIRTIKRFALPGHEDRNAQLLVNGIKEHTMSEDEVYLACGSLNGPVKTGLAQETTLSVKTLSDLDIVQRTPGIEGDRGQMAAAVGLALGGLGVGEALPFDLRQGSFKLVTPLAGLRIPFLRTAALLAVVGLFAVGSLVAGLNQDRREYAELQNRLELKFKELLPNSKPVKGQEPAQLKGELDSLRKRMADLSGFEGRGALSVLAALSAAIPGDVSLKLDELSYDSRKLRFEGEVNSFDAVDRIKAALDSDPNFGEVQVQNARVGANINKVTFRLQMEVL